MFILVGSVKRLSSIFFSHNFDIFLCYGKLLHFWRSLAWCLVMHEWKWFKVKLTRFQVAFPDIVALWDDNIGFAWIGISLVGPSECLHRSSIGLSELSKKPLFVVRSLKERLVMAMLLVLNENLIRGYLLKEWKNFLLF